MELSPRCCFCAAVVLGWRQLKEQVTKVEPERAQELGRRLRARREELGLSLRRLAERANVNDVTVMRLERGAFAAPRPDKLSRIAEVLGLTLADVFAYADYVVPGDLPSFHPYLLSKYRDMPQEAIDDLVNAFESIVQKHGYALEAEPESEGESP